MALSDDRIALSLSVPGGGAIPMVFSPPLGIADSVLIYAGAIVSIDSSGYARPGRASTTDVCIGIAPRRMDNTISGHAAGNAAVPVEIQVGVFSLDNDTGSPVLTTTAPGTALYVLDDHTVTLDSTSHIKAGKLIALDSLGRVFVQMGPAAAFP